MSHSLGIVIESLVAVLLMLTIGYCILLNSRLKRLKADEHSLKATIGELITATEIAERAIGGLKHTVRDVNEHLGSQLTAASQMSAHLKGMLAEGDGVIRRLSKIATRLSIAIPITWLIVPPSSWSAHRLSRTSQAWSAACANFL